MSTALTTALKGPQGDQGPIGPKGDKGDPGFGALWGGIGGTLNDQVDLRNALNSKLSSESDPQFISWLGSLSSSSLTAGYFYGDGSGLYNLPGSGGWSNGGGYIYPTSGERVLVGGASDDYSSSFQIAGTQHWSYSTITLTADPMYEAIRIGYNVANYYNSAYNIQIGANNFLYGYGSGTVQVGAGVTGNGDYNTLIGDNIQGRASYDVALGYYADAAGTGSIAIGYAARAGDYMGMNKDYTIALGYSSFAAYGWSTAIGYSVSTTRDYETVIGGLHPYTYSSEPFLRLWPDYMTGNIRASFPKMPTSDPMDGFGTLWYDSMTRQVYYGT